MLLFMSSIYELFCQQPTAFEWTKDFLLFLMDNVHAVRGKEGNIIDYFLFRIINAKRAVRSFFSFLRPLTTTLPRFPPPSSSPFVQWGCCFEFPLARAMLFFRFLLKGWINN